MAGPSLLLIPQGPPGGVASGQRNNLVPNPNFERDTAGWVANAIAADNADFVVSPLWSSVGQRSLHSKTISTGATHAGGVATSGAFNLVGGRIYKITVVINLLVKGANAPYITLYGAGTGFGGSGLTNFSTIGVQTVTATFTAPRTGAADLFVGFVPAALGGNGLNNAETLEFYVDAVQLEETVTSGTYFDGDIPGFEWTGTPGNSASRSIGAPLDLMDGSNIIVDGGDNALQLPVPSMDEDYAESPDSEGGKRSRSRPTVPKGTLKLIIKGASSAAFWANVRKLQQAVNSVHDGGGVLLYTPQDGSPVGYDLESMYLTDLPQQNILLKQQVLSGAALEFTCLPYGRLTAQPSTPLSDIDTFQRDSITNQEWRFDAGSGTLSVSGGQLVPSTTANKRINRATNVVDGTAYAQVSTGAALAGFLFGPVLKRLDVNNAILGIIEGSANLSVYKLDGGALTRLATGAVTFNANTTYWLKLQMVGNAVVLTAYTTDPNGSNPTAPYGGGGTVMLTGADATKFGVGIKGSPGIWWTPNNTNERATGFRVDAASIESFDPQANFEVLNTPGSAPAYARLRMTDAASQARVFGEVGLDDRNYDRTNPQPTLIDSDALSISGLSGTQTTRAGAYNPKASGNSVISSTLGSSPGSPVAVCSTGVQGHVGPQKIRPRVWANGTGPVYVRLAYRIADGGWTRTSWVKVPGLGAFYDVTLGTIRIPKALLGAQSWEGRIEAYTASGLGTDLLQVDYVRVIPAKRITKVRSLYLPSSFSSLPAPALTGRDSFAQTAGNLGLPKVADSGQNWATSGATGDFQVDGSGHVTRSQNADVGSRRALLPVALAGDQVVGMDVTPTNSWVVSPNSLLARLLARATAASDTSDIVAEITFSSPSPAQNTLRVYNGATQIFQANGVQLPLLAPITATWTISWALAVFASIQTWGVYFSQIAGQPMTLLASGPLGGAAPAGTGAGFAHFHNGSGAGTTTFDNFFAFQPDFQPAIASGGYGELRHNAYVRSTGGRMNPEGPYLKIDPSGRDARGAQFSVAARRNDIDSFPDDQIADALKCEVDLTPRVVLLDG